MEITGIIVFMSLKLYIWFPLSSQTEEWLRQIWIEQIRMNRRHISALMQVNVCVCVCCLSVPRAALEQDSDT